MIESFQKNGLWFFPENPEERYFGSLSYSKEEGGELELFSNFDQRIPYDFNIILGVTSDSEEVTLYSGFKMSSGGQTLRSGKEVGISSSKFSVNYIFLGHHFNNKEEINFDQITVSYHNLDEWLLISGFKRQFDIEQLKKDFQEKKATVEYKLPESIDFRIDEDCNASFQFTATPPGLSVFTKEVAIRQKAYIQFKTKTSKDLDQILFYIFEFNNFLTLGLSEATFPTEIRVYNSNILDEYSSESLKRINLFISLKNTDLVNRTLSAHDMLFSYPRIKQEFNHIIREWYSLKDKLKPVFNLFFDSFYNNPNRFDENKFLNMAQAIETFHRRTNNRTARPKEEYKNIKTEILEAVDPEYKQWLKEKLAFANELTLHQRLEEVLKMFSNSVLDNIIPEKASFIKQVKDSRNYYTHYTTELEKKALKATNLFYLTEKLKLLLLCAILETSGFNKLLVEECAKGYTKGKFFASPNL